MIVKITSRRQVTLPARVLDAMGVGPGTLTTLGSELFEGKFRKDARRSTSTHSATAPMTQLCGTDTSQQISRSTRRLEKQSVDFRFWIVTRTLPFRQAFPYHLTGRFS